MTTRARLIQAVPGTLVGILFSLCILPILWGMYHPARAPSWPAIVCISLGALLGFIFGMTKGGRKLEGPRKRAAVGAVLGSILGAVAAAVFTAVMSVAGLINAKNMIFAVPFGFLVGIFLGASIAHRNALSCKSVQTEYKNDKE